MTDRVLPSRTDSAGRAASRFIGGPWGRHGIIGRQWFFTPLRALMLLVLFTLLLGWLQKAPCQSGNWLLTQPVKYDSGANTQVTGKQYVWACYSDIIPLYGIEGIQAGQLPYVEHTNEYPVLTGYFMYAAGRIAHAYDYLSARHDVLPRPPPVQTYYEVTALLLACCALVIVWAVASTARRRIWDAALVALSPVLIIHAFTNWDLLAVALASAGMLAWSRRKHGAAGLLFGLGAAAKLYPLLLLGPLLVLCIRARKFKEFGVALGMTAVGALVVNLPLALKWTHNWKQFFTLNETRPADFDSLWYVGQYLAGPGGVPRTRDINIGVALAFLVACAAIGWLGLAAARRPRVAQLAFLVVAAFLLTNKVWSPQYSLWLVPLAALARPSWRPYLIWQGAELVEWFTRMYWYLQSSAVDQQAHGYHVLARGLDQRWFIAAIIIRDLTLLAYAVLVVRDVLRPELDVVRTDGDDDPAGGVLDGAPDVYTIGNRAVPPGPDAPVQELAPVS